MFGFLDGPGTTLDFGLTDPVTRCGFCASGMSLPRGLVLFGLGGLCSPDRHDGNGVGQG